MHQLKGTGANDERALLKKGRFYMSLVKFAVTAFSSKKREKDGA